jgi:DMSO/TMAO reductase YedYZ molybdopterin-dependent catalytic subunit
MSIHECETNGIARRDLLVRAGFALASLSAFDAMFAKAFATETGNEVIRWLDQPPPIPAPAVGAVRNLQAWEDLDSWITPNDKFFSIGHYNWPDLDPNSWTLEVTGLVNNPLRYTLAQLQSRARRNVIFTLECSGDRGFPWFQSAVSTAQWGGTPLAPILTEAGPKKDGIEVVFIGSDAGEETVRDLKFTTNMARSMSLSDAMDPNNLLAYEMNQAPLPQQHGFPVRLIAPGWYGIANTKWLKRIEVIDRRFEGKFMGRDYVTVRENKDGDQTFWMQSSVGRSRISSAPARVLRRGNEYQIVGAAWGGKIDRVEVQVDGGAWLPATIEPNSGGDFTWKFWSVPWPSATPGEHTIASRAIDSDGNVQPTMESPTIAGKRTYWESNGQLARRVRV